MSNEIEIAQNGTGVSEIAQPKSKSDALWCIYIAGPDDLVAMPSKPVAEAVARNFNAVWDRYGAERGRDVHAVAHVEPWMHGKEAHGKDLREHFHEYADLVLDEDAERFKPEQPVQAVDVKRADDLAVKLWNDFWEKKIDPKDTWRELRAAIASLDHPRPTGDVRDAVKRMASSLAENEWADHVLLGDPDVTALEVQITRLIGELQTARTAPTGDAKVLTTQAILDRIEAVARQADSEIQSNDEKHLRNTLEIVADDLTAIIAAHRVPVRTGDVPRYTHLPVDLWEAIAKNSVWLMRNARDGHYTLDEAITYQVGAIAAGRDPAPTGGQAGEVVGEVVRHWIADPDKHIGKIPMDSIKWAGNDMPMHGTKLYAEPLPVGVPGQMGLGDARNPFKNPLIHDGFTSGWNACREAMLAAAPDAEVQP